MLEKNLDMLKIHRLQVIKIIDDELYPNLLLQFTRPMVRPSFTYPWVSQSKEIKFVHLQSWAKFLIWST